MFSRGNGGMGDLTVVFIYAVHMLVLGGGILSRQKGNQPDVPTYSTFGRTKQSNFLTQTREPSSLVRERKSDRLICSSRWFTLPCRPAFVTSL